MKSVLVIFSILIIFCGCSTNHLGNNENHYGQDEDTSIDNITPTNSISLLESLDITDVICLEPLNDDTIYIIGAKRDSAFPQREVVFAVCNIENQETVVLHREFTSIDGYENACVYLNEDGYVEFFTGQQIITVSENKAIKFELIASGQKEVFVDLSTGDYATIDTNNNLYFCSNGNTQKIYESEKKADSSGNLYTYIPYSVQYKNQKLLFGIAKNSSMNYKNIVISDDNGNIISDTGKLEIKADHIFFYWTDSGFVTIETSNYLPDGTEKEMTFFTEYNNEGKIISEKVISGTYLDGQGKMYDGSSFYAYAFKNGSDFGVAIYDFYDETAYQIEIVEGYVISPTITPSGNKVIWANNGSVFFEDINNIKSNTIIENIK